MREQTIAPSRRSHFFTSEDGLCLHACVYKTQGKTQGAGRDQDTSPYPPLICLPGLSRTARDFHPLATVLHGAHDRPRDVYALDYRGRGQSAYDPNWKNYTPFVEAQDVICAMDRFGLESADFLGTSRGGIIILVLALKARNRIRRFIFNDIGPRVNMSGLLGIKHRLGHTPEPQTWEEAAAMLRNQFASQFPSLDHERWLALAKRTYRNDGGRPRRDYDTNLLKTLDDLNEARELPALWEPFKLLVAAPGLVIHGENSDILTRDIIDEMCQIKPDLQVHTVPDQGHVPLLDDVPTQNVIGTFLNT